MNRSYDDFEEFAADASEWSVETSLLDRNGFRADLLQLVHPDGGFHVVRTRMDARVRQVGEPPPGMRTFCVPAVSDLRMEWRRRQVGGNDLMVFPLGGELDAGIQPGFDMFIVSIPEATFARQMETVRGSGTAGIDAEVFRCEPAAIGRLRRLLLDFTRLFAARPGDRRVTAALEHVLDSAARTLSTGSVGPRVPGRLQRHAATRQAVAYLGLHAQEAPTVRRLCRITGVSDRTLETGFKELYGVGPKAYVNAVRLNGLRSGLRASDPETTVIADLANEWGFWHIGQLAAEYRRMFGELPSETLARSRS